MREIIPKVLFCACNILCLHRDPPSICNNRQDLKKRSCFRSHKCHYIFITKQLSLQNNVFLLYSNDRFSKTNYQHKQEKEQLRRFTASIGGFLTICSSNTTSVLCVKNLFSKLSVALLCLIYARKIRRERRRKHEIYVVSDLRALNYRVLHQIAPF